VTSKVWDVDPPEFAYKFEEWQQQFSVPSWQLLKKSFLF
jgi:hypothetical protein